MISRTLRPSFLPTRFLSRSGGWQRPDPPQMIQYQNRRTLGLITKFLHRNDGVAPAYIINDYSNQQTLGQRYYNFFKHSFFIAIFLSPFIFLSYIQGSKLPEYVDTGAIDIKKRHNRWLEEGKYEELRKNNPFGLEPVYETPNKFVYSDWTEECNQKHEKVRKQGKSYINRLTDEVRRDMENGSRHGHRHEEEHSH